MYEDKTVFDGHLPALHCRITIKTGNIMNRNDRKCTVCGDENSGIKSGDKLYCRQCASDLMARMKQQYYSGAQQNGWEIQELWEQLRETSNRDFSAELFDEEDEINGLPDEEREFSSYPSDAQILLRAFVREKLRGNLQNFLDFDFETLRGDERFGSKDSEHFDCDDTAIIRAVYVLLWRRVFPGLNAPGSIGTGKAYRGDTIHTFHTIFGRPNSEAPGHFFGIDRFAPIDDRLYERIRAFHRQSRTLGNYMVLPNIGLPVGRRILTLNTWRGTNRWHDYVDQFLLALEPCLDKGDRSDEILHRLVHERNALAFAEYMRPGGFAALANKLWDMQS